MDVVYFSKASETGPSSRYRIFQYLPFLRHAEIHVSVQPLFRSQYFHMLAWRPLWVRTIAKIWYTAWRFIVRGVGILSHPKAELIVLEGPLFPYAGLGVERWFSKRVPLVVELDDAIYLTPGFRKTVPELLKLSAGAIVGNQVLATYARAFTPHVHVIPTVVDTKRFSPRSEDPPSTSAPMTLVWVGLDYNVAYLEWLVPVLRRLQAVRPVRVKMICATPPRFDGLTVEFCKWEYGSEVEALRDGTIGMMPLPDNEWTRGKCGLKLLQYMSLGMASIASPVGVNQDIIQDGTNGFLAATEEEWHDKLLRLCDDHELRERLGREARKTVLERYSLDVWAPRLVASYHSLSNVPNTRNTRPSCTKAA